MIGRHIGPTSDSYRCGCESSDFTYDQCGHVLTGDLKIIENDDLRNLLVRGPKYREQRKINLRANKKIILSAVENFVKKWAKREKVDPSVLDKWLELVKKKVVDAIYINTDAFPIAKQLSFEGSHRTEGT